MWLALYMYQPGMSKRLTVLLSHRPHLFSLKPSDMFANLQ